MHASAIPAPPGMFRPRTVPRMTLLAGYVLALFGACLCIASAAATEVPVPARDLIGAAGIAELVVAAGLATGAGWAGRAAVVVVVAGFDAIAGAVLALAVGLDVLQPTIRSSPPAGNSAAILVLLALGYWIVLTGARRLLRSAV